MGQQAIDHMFNNFELIGNLTMPRYAAVKATTVKTYYVENVNTNFIKRRIDVDTFEFTSLEGINIDDTVYIIGDFCPAAQGINGAKSRIELIVSNVSCVTIEKGLWMIESPEVNLISFDCQAQMYELMGVVQTPEIFEYEGETYTNPFNQNNVKDLLRGTLDDYKAAQSKHQNIQRIREQQQAPTLSLESLFGATPQTPIQEPDKTHAEPSFDGLLF